MNDTPTTDPKDTPKAKKAEAKPAAKAAAKAEEVVTDATAKVEAAAEAAKETAADATEAAQDAVTTVEDTAKDAAAKVEEVAKDAAAKVEDVAKDAAAKVEDVAKAAGSQAEDIKAKVMATLDSWSKALTSKSDPHQVMMILYASYALSIFTFGLTAVAGYVLILRKKRDEMKGDIYESHITWMDRTFLFSAGAVVVGLVLGLFVNAGLITILGFVYLIYRTIKGFLALYEKKPIEDPNALY